MTVIWNSNLVILSVLIAIYGSFVALSHIKRMRETTGKVARAWMIAGAVTLGFAIWSMHFIGMLAAHLPIPITYDVLLTVVSVIPAIAAALLGLYLLRTTVMQPRQITAGGFLMGIGIATMHYTGMAALKMQPAISYDPLLFMASLVIAIIAAIAALLIVYAGEKSGLHVTLKHTLSAIILGLAIAGMHYTAMAAASYAPGSLCTASGSRIEPTLLALIIASIVFLLFTAGWIVNLLDRWIVLEHTVKLTQLQGHTQELELDQDILKQINLATPLQQILESLIRQTEALHPEMIGTILLLDKIDGHLRHGAAPSMPNAFNEAMHDSTIDQGAASCGVATYSGQRVIVEDVQQHPYWAQYQDLARLGNIRACWSQPIKSHDNRVLGTFNVYHRQPATPSETQLDLIERYAHLAQLAIERTDHAAEIHHMAFYDPLTQLPNRRLLTDRLQQTFAASARNNHHGALLFIDLDHFKTLNDSKGHHIGDLMLQEVAHRLSGAVREYDTVARLGGDEFIIALTDLDEDAEKAALQARTLGEKILETINLPYLLKDYTYHGTASIGISTFYGNTVTVNDLLKHADTAMYQSKNAGRNRLHFFNLAMQETLEARFSLQSDLRKALAEQQLSLHYQIQLDDQHRIFGAEALLRWNHPVLGQISPAIFIPLAEETGLIVPIGNFVLEAACTQLKIWESDAKMQHLQLAVNVSAYQLKQPDFVHQVLAILKRTKANPSKLTMELTESLMLANILETIEKMQLLKAVGTSFAMDDFGTGYSSMLSLKRLPLQQLKIDKSFVHDIATNANATTIVKTIIAMGHTLGLSVIAEGVETETQLTILKQHTCPAFQGYLFSHPLPIEQFQALIQTWLPPEFST